jgi:hypothetical protein
MAEQPDAVDTAPLDLAIRALRFRDRSAAELEARLQQRGVGAAEREQALETLERIGYVDDERFARTRAAQLAERGSGDALIRHDLEGRGVSADLVELALGALEPERERGTRLRRGLAGRARCGGGLRSCRIPGASIRRFACKRVIFRTDFRLSSNMTRILPNPPPSGAQEEPPAGA